MDGELTVLLVDDEAEHRRDLRSALAAFPFVTVAGEAGGGEEALAFLLRQRVDLVFLDIEMEGVDGFQLARHLQTEYPELQVIFLTGHVDLAIDGYQYGPVDFLAKPVELMRLTQALRRAQRTKEQTWEREREDVTIGIHVDGGLEILRVSDVLYLEKSGRRVAVVDRRGSRLSSCDSLQKLQPVFEQYGFYRCHQSFLVALDKIRGIRTDDLGSSYSIQLEGVSKSVPLSRAKYNELRTLLGQRGLTIY